jgi:hypothetical protein
MVGNVFKVCMLFICLTGSGGLTVDAASSAKKGQKTAYDYYLSGNALYSDGQYGEAILAFRKSLELNPKHYYSRANLGAALGKTGQFGKAAGEFTFCIRKKWGGVGDRVTFHFNRALALEAGANATAALDDRATLRQLDPARSRQPENSAEYILMDLAYMAGRNQLDKTRLFNQNRSKVMRGDIVIREVANTGKEEQEHEVIGVIDGKLEQVAGVLADYKNYPKFMPNVKEIVVRNSKDGGKIVDHKLGFPMGFVKKYRLKFRSENEAGRWQLHWKKLPWPGVKSKETVVDTYGQWIIEKLPGSDNKVLAYYRVYTDTGKIPFGTGWIVEPMTKKSFQNMFKGTRKRVKALYD